MRGWLKAVCKSLELGFLILIAGGSIIGSSKFLIARLAAISNDIFKG